MFVYTGWAVLRENIPVTLCNSLFAFPKQNKHCRELIARGDHSECQVFVFLPPEGWVCPPAGPRGPVVVLLWCLVRILDNLLS